MSQIPVGVYKKIHRVISELRKEGISKSNEAKGFGMGYKFRGIDDVYNALSGVISEVGLIIIPKVVWTQSNMIARDGGKFSEHVITHTEFTMVDPDDGSSIMGSAYGEAIDTSDKAYGKAQSYAYKAFAFQAFCIPTEGDNDTENHNHDIAPSANKPQQKPQNQPQNGAEKGKNADETSPLIKEIRALGDVKTFLLFMDKLAPYSKSIAPTEFNKAWHEYKLRGSHLGLEWDKEAKHFISVPADTTPTNAQTQSATH